MGNSANVVSDRKKKESIYNDFLKQKIYIDEAKTDNGKVEYSSYIVKGDMYYQLSGIMPKKEFKKIVEKILFYTVHNQNILQPTFLLYLF